MSIRIDKITRGRFGNKILQYNSLIQLGKKHNVSCSMVQNNEMTYFFKNIVPFIPSKKPIKLLTCKMVLEDEKLDFKNYEYKIDDPAYCLHNVFYKVTNCNPRNFLELKEEFKTNLPSDTLNIGIHIRGGDIISRDGNNGREIHEFKYYKDSIHYVLENFCKNKKYILWLCTDDINFQTFKETYKYLIDTNLPVRTGKIVGNQSDYIYDWATLSECDILINSSSTFCVTAGFLGKSDKKIIHSKKWLDKNINHEPWNNNISVTFFSMRPDREYSLIDYRKKYDDFWINILKNNNWYFCNKNI